MILHCTARLFVKKHVFKILCPDSVAAHIIGHSGTTRQEIENASGSNIWVSKRDCFFPDTKCRILVIHADEPNKVFAALQLTVPKLVDVALKEREKGGGKGGPDPDAPLMGKEDGEFIYRFCLPSLVKGQLIGPKGANIKDLRERTRAKIFVENEIYDEHQAVRIIGTQEKILGVLLIVHEMIQNQADDPRFHDWALHQVFGDGKGCGKGGKNDKGGKDHYDDRDDRRGGKGEKGFDDRGDRGDRGGRDNRGGDNRSHGPSNVDVGGLLQLAGEFPQGAIEMDHALNFELPSGRVGALIGKSGEYVRHVEGSTGAKVAFEGSKESEYRSISITGPLMATYAAHLMLMKKYHEKECEELEKSSMKAQKTNALESQIAELQAQLEEAKRGGGGARW